MICSFIFAGVVLLLVFAPLLSHVFTAINEKQFNDLKDYDIDWQYVQLEEERLRELER